MANKDGEASVEDILRSIKQVISREDGPRGGGFSRGNPAAGGGDSESAAQQTDEGSERASSFAPYNFSRPSPFGARSPITPPPLSEPEEAEIAEPAEDEGRSDVFDLRSLDSSAFEEPAAENIALPADDLPAEEAPAEEAEDDSERVAVHSPWDAAEEPEVIETVVEEVEVEIETASVVEVEDEPAASDGPVIHPSIEAQEEPTEPEPVLAPEGTVEDEIEEAAAEPEPFAAFDDEEEVGETESDEDEPAAIEPAPIEAADDTLIAGAAADALRDRFAALQAVAQKPSLAAAGTASPANPLEDMVREMMRPMLKQWLDDNMPGLVEKIVEREIARITGQL